MYSYLRLQPSLFLFYVEVVARFMRADMLISHDQLGHAIDQFGQLLGTI